MDVVEFTSKAGYKILSLTHDFLDEFSVKGESDVWQEVYLLSEAIYVVNSDITTDECIAKIIDKLNIRCGLSGISEPSTDGFGDMTVDASRDCNTFSVGSEAGVCDLLIGETIIVTYNTGGSTIHTVQVDSVDLINSVGDVTYTWRMYDYNTDALIETTIGPPVIQWDWDTIADPEIYIIVEVTDDICTVQKQITSLYYRRS